MSKISLKTVLGVDPGTNHTGYGLLQLQGSKITVITQGRLSPSPKLAFPQRLSYIFDGLRDLFPLENKPDVLALEDVFYALNVRSVIRLSHVRGIIMLLASKWGSELFEYAPTLVKSSVTGYGRADKNQVSQVVSAILKVYPKSFDASDALAVGLCHVNQSLKTTFLGGDNYLKNPSLGRGKKSSWRSFNLEDIKALSHASGVKSS